MTNTAITAKDVIAVVDAPTVSLAPNESAGDILLHFYRALGWNGNDLLDPCKVRTTEAVYNHLYDQIYEHYPNFISVGIFMVNRGPGVENDIPAGKVHLLEGWVKPVADEEGAGTNVAL